MQTTFELKYNWRYNKNLTSKVDYFYTILYTEEKYIKKEPNYLTKQTKKLKNKKKENIMGKRDVK